MKQYHFTLHYINGETEAMEIPAIDRSNAWLSLVMERHGPGHSVVDMSDVVGVSLDMDTQ